MIAAFTLPTSALAQALPSGAPDSALGTPAVGDVQSLGTGLRGSAVSGSGILNSNGSATGGETAGKGAPFGAGGPG